MSNSLRIKELRHDTQEAQEFFSKCLAYTLGPVELQKMMDKGGVRVVDVRRREDYQLGHIKNALSIPKDELTDALEQLSKDDISIVYCYNQQCHLGASACLTLAEYGYPTMLLEGGLKTWAEEFQFEVVK